MATHQDSPNSRSSRRDCLISDLSIMLLVFPVLLIGISWIGYWSDRPMNGVVNIGISLAITIMLSRITSGDKTRCLGVATLLAFAILICAGLYASWTWDMFYDSQAYHLPAIIALADGWNPVRYPDVCAWKLDNCDLSTLALINHYPKSTWLLAANVYDATGWFETGKLFNITSAIASVLVFHRFYSGFSRLKQPLVLLLSLVTPVSTIVVKQHASFYVDGITGSYLAIICGAMLSYFVHGDKKAVWIFCCAAPVALSIKFTGLAYISVLVAVGVLFYFRNLMGRRLLVPALITLTLAAFFGFNPYVTNYQSESNPFFPAITQNTDVLENMADKNFLKQSNLEKFLQSLVSVQSEKNYLKPRWIGFDDLLRSPVSVDERFGGFGGLMPIIMFLAGGTFLSLLFLPPKGGGISRFCNHFAECRWLIFIVSAVMGSVLIFGASWWARLIPHLWILPGLIAGCALMDHRRVVKISGYAISILLVLQLLVASSTTVAQVENSLQLHDQYRHFLHMPVRIVDNQEGEPNVRAFRLTGKTRLKDFGIRETAPGKLATPCRKGYQYRGFLVCD